tara:strand:+ start:1708 stop:5106 length:3399 start_codon:yes stop_codon:yes gene_type:complete
MSAKVTAKAVSQVSNQIPQFISDENPLYEKFLKNYYEFLETLCVYFSVISGYTYEFTLGETVTGQTSGATGKVKGTGAFTGYNKLFLEPLNNLNFQVDEVVVGSTSSSRGTITKLNRKPLNGSKTFRDLIDPDLTSEGILDWFKKEFYPNIRNSASVDLRYFLKHLKKFYRSKGSEKSYRTLFRALYGQDTLDFYYPKVDMLKVSDGNWLQDTVLQLAYDVSYLDFNGLTIVGQTSLATAFVSNVTTRKIGSVPIIELVVTTFVGTFLNSETITATKADETTLSAALTGMLTNITIVDGGEGYIIDETVAIADPTGVGYGAAAKVKSTSADQVAVITITGAGNGYQVNDPLTFDNTGTNAVVGAAAKVATLSDTFTVDVVSTEITAGVETKTFDLTGAFGVAVSAGYLLGNNAIYANSTKKGVVVSYTVGTPSVLSIYDMYEENAATTGGGSLVEWVTTDVIYLFDKNGSPVLGAFSVTINDASITNPTSHIALNAATYGSGFSSPAGTFTSSGTTVGITYTGGHNLSVSDPVKLAFSTGSMDGTYNVASVTSSTVFTVTIANPAASGTVTMTPYINSVMKNGFTFETQTFGKVATVSYSSHGSGYIVKPTATLTSLGYYSTVETRSDGAGGFYGSNAVTTIGDLGGTITAMTITEPGFGYAVDPTITATTHSVQAQLTSVLGITRTKDGKYSGESGFPSSTKKVQDNSYYQDYSYVLKTTNSVDVWRSDVLKLLHPAGYKLFGEVLIENLLNTQMFNRGLNNINTIDATGMSTYREMTFFFETLLQGLRVEAGETFLEPDIQIDALIFDLLASYAIMTVVGASSQVYGVSPFTATDGVPADMFSTFFVENSSSVSVGNTTTITTATPHHFREDDLVSLDDFVGTNVSIINGNLYKATAIGDNPATNNTFVLKEVDETINLVLDSTDGSADAGDNITMEDETTTFSYEDRRVDTTGMSITTQGKVFRSGSRMSSGILIDMYSTEYIDLLKDNQIHEYEHNSPTNMSAFSAGNVIDISGRHVDIESHVIQEDAAGNDSFLLEDGVKPSDGGYSGTTSVLGYILADEGQIDLDGANNAHELVATPAVQKQVLNITNNILSFNRPFSHKGVPYTSYPHTLGFGYYKHRVDQRLSA